MNIAAFNEQDWRTLMETGYSEEAIRSAMRFALEEARGDDFVPDETETVLRDFLKSLTEKG